ncbi:MAG: DUF6678 family protein [Bacteroidota bacterium]
MEDSILKYVADKQLTSCMNKTKWKELISELSSIENYEPMVNIKLIFDQESNDQFSAVRWNEVERNGFELIEWIKINPIRVDIAGRLMDNQETDFTEALRNALDKHAIQYEYDRPIFTVYGYRRMN